MLLSLAQRFHPNQSIRANSTENALLESSESVTADSIKRELFEGDNIITDMNNDRGLSELQEKKNKEKESVDSGNLEEEDFEDV